MLLLPFAIIKLELIYIYCLDQGMDESSLIITNLFIYCHIANQSTGVQLNLSVISQYF